MARTNYNIVIVLVLAFGTLSFAQATKEENSETKISQEDLPAAVVTAFQEAYPNAQIISTSQETDSGTTYYEIESREGSIHRDLIFLADGTVNAVEQQLEATALPAVIRDTIHKNYPSGNINKAESVIEGGVTSYELLVKSGEDQYEVAIGTDGHIIRVEKMGEDQEEDDDSDSE